MVIDRQAYTLTFLIISRMLVSNNFCMLLLSTMSEPQREISVSLNSNYEYGPGFCGFYSLVGGMVGFIQLLQEWG